MNECCATCRRMKDLVQLDYSHGGCDHTYMEGYACTVFANEGQIAWMVGLDPEMEMCEAYEPKEKT